MVLLGFIPLLLVGALLAWAFVALLRQSEGGLALFADAIFTWAGSVVGIWLGLAIVGLVVGALAGALAFAVVLMAVHLLQPAASWFQQLLLAVLAAATVFGTTVWRFLSLDFLRR